MREALEAARRGQASRGRRSVAAMAMVAIAALLLGSCSSDGDSADTPTTSEPTTSTEPEDASTTTAPDSGGETLDILVTNDDGVTAPGIDALVNALEELPDVDITVVAPLENRSGSSDTTTEGPVAYSDATTVSGHEATAVDGFPADSVNVAIEEMGLDPDLVISGINAGQNLGPVSEISGTVGAARTAARHGIPAIATSQGEAEEPDFESGVEQVLAWLDENRGAILAGELDAPDPGGPAAVFNLNIPTCATGEVKDYVEVDLASDAEGALTLEVDCTVEVADPDNDIEAFNSGYASLTVLTAT